MRLILMGTGPFAVPSFEALRERGYEIVHVVTRPTVASIGKKEQPSSPVRKWAADHNLPIAAPASINDSETVQWLALQHADLMVVCDYGQILSRAALATSRLGGINLHGSLLPRHRGAAPVQWSILSGDQLAGVSVIHMTPALDGGPVLRILQTEIASDETASELEIRLSRIGVSATTESVAALESKGNLEECIGLGMTQDKALATKAPRLAKQDGELNLNYQVRYIDRLVRGLQTWPGTFAQLQIDEEKELRLIVPKVVPFQCSLDGSELGRESSSGSVLFGNRLNEFLNHHPALQSEMQTRAPDTQMIAVAVDGVLAIPQVQPAGKRLMSAEEFLRGHSRCEFMRINGEPSSHRLLNQMSCS
jgi:methionyl-tRNA formyltransferase